MTKRYKVMMENIHLTGTLAQKCIDKILLLTQ